MAGSTVLDAIESSGAPHSPGASVGIMKRTESVQASEVREYLLETTKGELRIELINSESPSAKQWHSNYRNYEGIPFRWDTKNAISFGPFSEDLVPTREEIHANRDEVFFGAGGFDPSNYHLIFSLNPHSSTYGTPEEGAFGRIVAGKQLLSELSAGDSIVSIEPVVEWAEEGDHLLTADMSVELEDGDQLYTYVRIEMNPEAPEGVDHFFTLIEDGTFNIDYASSSFIADSRLLGEACTYENFEPRDAGTVWVRTVGYGTGKFFISRDSRAASIMHSVIGNVASGIELVKMAQEGHHLFVRTSPEPLDILGLGFEEAKQKLETRGVELLPEGYQEDDAIIVSLEPQTTIEILAKASVKATGVPKNGVVEVELYDDLAPKTLDFFRHATSMTFKPVGSLSVMMKYENTFLFKAGKEAEKYKEILPENTPDKKANAMEIGVTNQAAKRAGLIGVRMVDDDLFGPTGEKFTSTNIIGKILEPEKLESLKEGETMYILERRV
ncbi:putative methanogenesis marker protein 3 [Methanohalophilus levihalophilus]|uniref:methyl-coenzyme M reductase-associated protein Mmp3 n=1 Tax=Methanohalophilus levihalophilus TaxID=1431282 RepID=UPI001FD9CD83|nr:putative methanogenesis marker protein 3 [Methanohalophilus levihalophilus]